VALGQVNFGITETGITGVPSDSCKGPDGVPQLEFQEENTDSLAKDASDLKNAVNRLIDNKQTPSLNEDLKV
jgi:hypothetical protein